MLRPEGDVEGSHTRTGAASINKQRHAWVVQQLLCSLSARGIEKQLHDAMMQELFNGAQGRVS